MEILALKVLLLWELEAYELQSTKNLSKRTRDTLIRIMKIQTKLAAGATQFGFVKRAAFPDQSRRPRC